MLPPVVGGDAPKIYLREGAFSGRERYIELSDNNTDFFIRTDLTNRKIANITIIRSCVLPDDDKTCHRWLNIILLIPRGIPLLH